MTSATKSQQGSNAAKSTAPAPSQNGAPAGGFSFASLSVKDAEVPTTRITPADNPLLDAFKSSAATRKDLGNGKWEGQGKSVTIPASACPDFERYVRQCAELLNCGSMIRLRTEDGKIVDVVSVGATEKINPETGKKRMTGGTPTPMVGGKQYTGNVVAFFRAKSARNSGKK